MPINSSLNYAPIDPAPYDRLHKRDLNAELQVDVLCQKFITIDYYVSKANNQTKELSSLIAYFDAILTNSLAQMYRGEITAQLFIAPLLSTSSLNRQKLLITQPP